MESSALGPLGKIWEIISTHNIGKGRNSSPERSEAEDIIVAKKQRKHEHESDLRGQPQSMGSKSFGAGLMDVLEL